MKEFFTKTILTKNVTMSSRTQTPESFVLAAASIGAISATETLKLQEWIMTQ